MLNSQKSTVSNQGYSLAIGGILTKLFPDKKHLTNGHLNCMGSQTKDGQIEDFISKIDYSWSDELKACTAKTPARNCGTK